MRFLWTLSRAWVVLGYIVGITAMVDWAANVLSDAALEALVLPYLLLCVVILFYEHLWAEQTPNSDEKGVADTHGSE